MLIAHLWKHEASVLGKHIYRAGRLQPHLDTYYTPMRVMLTALLMTARAVKECLEEPGRPACSAVVG